MNQAVKIRPMAKPLPIRVRLFIAVAFCTLLAIPGVLLLTGLLTDLDSPSILGSACFIFLVIAMWPLVLGADFFHGDPPVAVSLVLFVVSVLFWAWLVDLGLVFKKRNTAKHNAAAKAAAR